MEKNYLHKEFSLILRKKKLFVRFTLPIKKLSFGRCSKKNPK